MLPHHFVEQLKAQNWTTVALEFLGVVFGVFIGIQAANWNDERLARATRSALIERLLPESEASVYYFRRYLDYIRAGTEARASVLEKTADGNIEAVEQNNIVLAVNHLITYPPVAPPRSVYSEIIAAGQFSELGNENLREAISNFHVSVDHLTTVVAFSRASAERYDVWRHPAISKHFDPEDVPMQTRTVVDAELALSDPLFVKSLQMGHAMQMLLLDVWEGTLMEAQHMCEEIARYAGRICAAATADSSSGR